MAEDASALLSGTASNPERPPGLLIAALYRGEFEPVVCPILLGEVRRGLGRGYFRNHVAEHDIERVVLTLARASIQLRDPKDPPSVVRTPPTTTSSRSRSPHAPGHRHRRQDLLDHQGLHPPALTVRAACELLGLL